MSTQHRQNTSLIRKEVLDHIRSGRYSGSTIPKSLNRWWVVAACLSLFVLSLLALFLLSHSSKLVLQGEFERTESAEGHMRAVLHVSPKVVPAIKIGTYVLIKCSPITSLGACRFHGRIASLSGIKTSQEGDHAQSIASAEKPLESYLIDIDLDQDKFFHQKPFPLAGKSFEATFLVEKRKLYSSVLALFFQS